MIFNGLSNARREFPLSIPSLSLLLRDFFEPAVLDNIALLPCIHQALELFGQPLCCYLRAALWAFRVLIVEAIIQAHSRNLLKESSSDIVALLKTRRRPSSIRRTPFAENWGVPDSSKPER